jgi:SAM-dependent methyltransferase
MAAVRTGGDESFAAWLEALRGRHEGRLSFQELRRCVQSLSSIYVERRGDLARGEALATAGRRAAFALFYGPLHFLLLRSILAEVAPDEAGPPEVLDLGCGTGVAGAAWALQAGGAPRVAGIDRNPWAVLEARFTLKTLGLRGSARQGDLVHVAPRARGAAIVAAFCVDELDRDRRALLRRHLEAACARGARLLVVEPISRRTAPWWEEWRDALAAAGAAEARPDVRDDEWAFAADLPGHVAELDHAAGLDHSVLKGRSLYVAPRRGSDQVVAAP